MREAEGQAGNRIPAEPAFGELPELTRTLRAFGSARRSPGAMQSLFFRPLLDARRRAADASTPEARVRAFDPAELAAALDRCVDRMVADWPDAREPARRAIRAQIAERVDEYRTALTGLETVARALRSPSNASMIVEWRAWTRQLELTFQSADRAWIGIQSVVDALPRRVP